MPAVREATEDLLTRGLVHLCAVTELELGHSATSAEHYDRELGRYRAALPYAPVPDGAWARAGQVQRMLVDGGKARGVGVPDLLIAATAELNRLTVLHYDHDFDLISAVTGQPTAWAAPRGTVP